MQLSAIRQEMVTDMVNGSSSPNGSVISPIEADSVANAFVRQFYTTISENRNDVQKFYGHESMAQAEERIVTGQQDIANYYIDLLPEKVKIKVNSIRGTPTLRSGILVQSLGFINHRPFIQTFVLGQQSLKKYYVENDLFQFIDNYFESERPSAPVKHNGKPLPKVEEIPVEPIAPIAPKKVVHTPKKVEESPKQVKTPVSVEKTPEPVRQAPTPKRTPVQQQQAPQAPQQQPEVIRQEPAKPKTWANLFGNGESKPTKAENVQQAQPQRQERFAEPLHVQQQVPRDTHPQTPNANRGDAGSLAERKIYLGGITRSIVPDSTATAETEIKTLFYQFGEVEDVYMPRKVLESPNDMSKTAFAFITMRNLLAAQKVFESAVKDENGVFQLKLKIDAFGFDGIANISEQRDRPYGSFRGRGGGNGNNGGSYQTRGGFQPRGRGGPSGGGNRGFRGGFQNNRSNGQH